MKHINKIGYFFLRNNLKIPNLFSKNFISFYEKSFLKNLIYKEKINCVLDVGSHRGSFIKSLRSMGYNGQIVSFEPTLTNYNYQRENFQNDKKIRFYNLALGDINCEQKINIMDLSNMNSLLEPINKKIKNKINVKVKRLDSLMNDILEPIKNPKIFCKIDTQGYDLNVLKGAVKFTKFFSIVQTEISMKPLYNNSPNFIKSFEYFDLIGFEAVQLFPCSVNKQLRHTLEYDCILVKKT